MSTLRSSFFIAFVSLCVLAGYGVDVFGGCCSHGEQAHAEHGKTDPASQVPAGEDGCQCVCHLIVTPLTPELMRMVDTVFIPADFVAVPNEFPPDAVPVGIDYPPQLA